MSYRIAVKPAISYCTSAGIKTTHGYINKVSIETINNTSGNNGGYADYTKLSATLLKGATFTISLTPGFISGAAYFEYWTVYIDYNQNGVFEPGEMVAKGHNAIRINKSFSIPSTALVGSTRMRIQMQEGAEQTNPCATYTYGEVEDYTINIEGNTNIAKEETVKPGVSADTKENAADFRLFPNPAKDNLIIEFTGAGNSSVKVNICNLVGQKLIYTQISSVAGSNILNLNTSKLGTGMYILEMENNGRKQQRKFLISR